MEKVFEISKSFYEQRCKIKKINEDTGSKKNNDPINIYKYVNSNNLSHDDINTYKLKIMNYDHYYDDYPFKSISTYFINTICLIESIFNREKQINEHQQIRNNEINTIRRNKCVNAFDKCIEKIHEFNFDIYDIRININYHDNGKYRGLFEFICRYANHLFVIDYRTSYYDDDTKSYLMSGLFINKLYKIVTKDVIHCDCNLLLNNNELADLQNYFKSGSFSKYININYPNICQLDTLIRSNQFIINKGFLFHSTKRIHFNKLNKNINYLVTNKFTQKQFSFFPFIINNVLCINFNNYPTKKSINISVIDIDEIDNLLSIYYDTFIMKHYGYYRNDKYYNHHNIVDKLIDVFGNSYNEKFIINDCYDPFSITDTKIDTYIKFIPANIHESDQYKCGDVENLLSYIIDVYCINMKYIRLENNDECVLRIYGYYYDYALISHNYLVNGTLTDIDNQNIICDIEMVGTFLECMDRIIYFIENLNYIKNEGSSLINEDDESS